jgi:hypothetical protein
MADDSGSERDVLIIPEFQYVCKPGRLWRLGRLRTLGNLRTLGTLQRNDCWPPFIHSSMPPKPPCLPSIHACSASRYFS